MFDNLVKDVRLASEDISRTAKAMAELDVSSALADLAVEKNYCRPQIDDSLVFDVKEGDGIRLLKMRYPKKTRGRSSATTANWTTLTAGCGF